jgi:hypothetical protein
MASDFVEKAAFGREIRGDRYQPAKFLIVQTKSLPCFDGNRTPSKVFNFIKEVLIVSGWWFDNRNARNIERAARE